MDICNLGLSSSFNITEIFVNITCVRFCEFIKGM